MLCLCRLVLPVVTALSLAVEEVAVVLAAVVVVETNRHLTANVLYSAVLSACWATHGVCIKES